LIKHVYAVDRAYIWLSFFLKKKKKKTKLELLTNIFFFYCVRDALFFIQFIY
jgi:hypothetical protein